MYYSIYKCRLCKKKFDGVATNTKDVAFDVITNTAFGLKQKYPMYPSMTEPHVCKDGSFGIADFLGMEYRHDAEEQDVKS